MKRRDLTRFLFASAANAAPMTKTSIAQTGAQPHFERTPVEIAAGVSPADYASPNGPMRYGARGDGRGDDTAAWQTTGRLNGHHFVPDGTYRITSKVQTSGFVTIVGATRQNTILSSTGFADYLLEVGSNPSGPNPNVGALQRLRFFGGASNTGLLHMNQLSHMWRLDDLLFQSSACPALVIDNCWDSNYTNIDILGCGSPLGGDPAVGAMVIVKNGSNNIYLRGIRLEHGPCGVLYIGENCSPIYAVTGKIDQGLIPQGAAAVTVERGSILVMDDFNITGVADHPVFNVAGALLLGNVSIYGGTGAPAINDRRAWAHLDGVTVPGCAGAAFGPAVSNLNLGSSQFYRSNISDNRQTTSVLHSRNFPVRLVERLAVLANGRIYEDRILIQTDAAQPTNNRFDNCYLVHNPTGTYAAGQPGARRKILTSFSNGQLLLQGNWACTTDSEWSIEFCGGHYTPNLAIAGIQMDPGMTLFTIVSTGVRIRSAPAYVGTRSAAAPGATQFSVAAKREIAGLDVTGYFLVDDTTGEPFLISYGMDASDRMAVMYDRTNSLARTGTYSIVAGYAANITQNGSMCEWSYAGNRKSVSTAVATSYGFDFNSLPLWGVGPAGAPSRADA